MRRIAGGIGSGGAAERGKVLTGLWAVLAVATPVFAAQIIPEARTFGESWQNAGYPGEIPAPARIVNVRDFGAVGDGVAHDYPAIAAAIAALSNAPGVVYFPAGTYLSHNTINVPAGVVLRGERSHNTTLLFDQLGHCISIARAQSGAFQPVLSGYTIQSKTIVVSNGSVFAAGDYAEIRQDNDPSWGASDWAPKVVGQILRIVAVAGNTLTLERPLRITYEAAKNPEIRKITPITEAGVENLRVNRLLAGTAEQRDNVYTIQLQYAARCWVRGVESTNTFGGHVALVYATQSDVTGCYLHHAWDYDGGGSGYGVRLEFKTGECRIENNIFQRLRHSMLIQAGVNGNVFGYNYSREPYRSEFPNEISSDITGHGNYPFANLFEGNVCQHIWIDASHGANGPLNTFFRNRAETYGFNMTDSLGHRQNIVGNETFRGTWSLLVGDGYALLGTNHFEYGNNTQADGIQPPGTTNLTDYSYYLNADPSVPPPLPAFWNIPDSFPPIGLPLALNPPKNIPARARFFSGASFTVGPPSLARQPTNRVVNAGQPATFSVEAYGTPQARYAWYHNGVPLGGQTNATLTIPVALPADAGDYHVVISDDYGSVRSATATLTVTGAAAPTASFTGSPTNGFAPLTVTFTDNSTGTITNRAWDFGDGTQTNATATVLTHTYTGAGTNTVILIVSGPLGSSTNLRPNYITVAAPVPPVASFTAVPTSGFAPQTVTFTDTSTGSITNRFWNLGDGTTTNLAGTSLVHTYTSPGTNLVTLIVRGPLGASTNTAQLVFFACPTILLSPLAVTNATAGSAYSQTITASGGVPPYLFVRIAGNLPPGLVLSTNGLLSGTPTAAGNYSFTVRATDFNGCSGSRSYAIRVVCPTITVLPETLPGGTVGVPYSQNLSGAGGTPAYAFAVTAGALPPGLQLSRGGLLDGTVTRATNAVFTITATDTNGCQGSRTYSVMFECAPLTVSPASLPPGTLGAGYGPTLTAANGTAPYQFAVTAGALPSGLSLSGSGQFVGACTESGVFSFTVTVTDANGCSGSRAYTVSVPPVADFYGSPTSGLEPLEVVFHDASAGAVTNRVWQFGDGTSTSTTAATVAHTYAEGTYSVTLTVSGPGGSGSRTKTNYIVVGRPGSPATDFTAHPTSGPRPLTVIFVNQTVGTDLAFHWDFGDGNTSAARHPTHTYTNEGVFTVSLRAIGGGTTNTTTKTDLIIVTNPPPSDVTPPVLTVISPTDLQELAAASIAVTGTATDDSGIQSVSVNGLGAGVDGVHWSRTMPLAAGTNTFTVIATDNSLNRNATTQRVRCVRLPLTVRIVTPTNGTVVAGRFVDVAGHGHWISALEITNNRIGSGPAVVTGTNWTAANVPLKLGTNWLFAVARDSGTNRATDRVQVIRVPTNYVNTTLRTTTAVLTLGDGPNSDNVILSGFYNDAGLTYRAVDTGEVLFGDYEGMTPVNGLVELRYQAPSPWVNTLMLLSFTPKKRTVTFAASGFTLTNLDPFAVAVSLGAADLGPDAIPFGVAARVPGTFRYQYGLQKPTVDHFFLGKSSFTFAGFRLTGTLHIRRQPNPLKNPVSFGIGNYDETLPVLGWAQGKGNVFVYKRPPHLSRGVRTMTLDFDRGIWAAVGDGVDLGFLAVNPVTEIRLEIEDFAAGYPARLIRKGPKFSY